MAPCAVYILMYACSCLSNSSPSIKGFPLFLDTSLLTSTGEDFWDTNSFLQWVIQVSTVLSFNGLYENPHTYWNTSLCLSLLCGQSWPFLLNKHCTVLFSFHLHFKLLVTSSLANAIVLHSTNALKALWVHALDSYKSSLVSIFVSNRDPNIYSFICDLAKTPKRPGTLSYNSTTADNPTDIVNPLNMFSILPIVKFLHLSCSITITS